MLDENIDISIMIIGVLVSFGVTYIPKFKDWFAKLSSKQKVFIVYGAILVASASISVFKACTPTSCELEVVGREVFMSLFLGLFSSQATYQVVKAIKASKEIVNDND